MEQLKAGSCLELSALSYLGWTLRAQLPLGKA